MIDLDKDTVDFQPNYDDSQEEPIVLPTRVPNLLANGSTGIAVGMASNIPPHNLTELMNAFLYYIEHRHQADIASLMELIPGPDFPTGGTIVGKQGIYEAYSTGTGSDPDPCQNPYRNLQGRKRVSDHHRTSFHGQQGHAP